MNAIAIQNSLLQYPTSVPCSTQHMSTTQTFNALRNQLSHHPQTLPSSNIPTIESLTHWSSTNRFTHPQTLTPSVPNSFNDLFLADDPQVLNEISLMLNTGHAPNHMSINPSFLTLANKSQMLPNPSNYSLTSHACNTSKVQTITSNSSNSDLSIHVITPPTNSEVKNTVGGGVFIKQPTIHVIEENIYDLPPNGNRLSFRRQDKYDKTSLFKTELCTNWMLTNSCTYGNKCHFAHGVEDLKPRMRVENYKTQPCCDPAREGCRKCMYGRRCNYCHPGEAIRRSHPTPYYDKDYYRVLGKDFGDEKNFPFGIYV